MPPQSSVYYATTGGGGGGGDTTPPVLSGGAPTGTLAAGTTQVTLQATTDEAATCRYSTTAGTAYAAMTNTFTTTGATTHSTSVTGLQAGPSTYNVRCIDAAGNADTADYAITFTITAGGGDTTPPVLSGGAPTGTLAAGTTQVTLQATTDEAATCRYSTTAGTAYAAMTNTFTTTGATTHSTSVTGLQAGPSTYNVRCIDAAGNADTADYAITFTITAGADTDPPTVSVTAPAANATVSGTTTVTANATDNVGVTGVQFLLDGANLGAEDTTSPYSVSWDSTTATNATHTITARARDAATNQTTSATVTVTVNNSAPPAGLRVGYPFSAGSGTTIADVSTNNTTGTATSPTWTTSGRFGNAITFNGTTSRVRSNSSLTLTAFTIEAWVLNPTNQAEEAIATVGSNRDVYLRNGTLSFWTGSTTLSFGAVATNTWQHVAVVSDGSTVRAYVEGVQSGSTQNVALGSFSGPLQVGAWTTARTTATSSPEPLTRSASTPAHSPPPRSPRTARRHSDGGQAAPGIRSVTTPA